MKRIGIVLTLVVAIFIMVVGCGDENEQFHPVKLKVTGVELTKGANAFTFHGVIPSECGEVIFTADTDEESAFLSELIIGNKSVDITSEDENPESVPYVIYEGEEGKVEISSLIPRVVKMTIYGNNDGMDRNFYLKFGCCYHESLFYLVQKGRK